MPTMRLVVFSVAVGAIFGQVDGPQAKPNILWQGQMHLGDNPEKYGKLTSAGISMEIPFKADPTAKYRLRIRASDVQTLGGDGHYVEVFAHFQQAKVNNEDRRELVGAFRIKDDTGQEKDYAFEPLQKEALKDKPSFFSVRIRVDSSIRFGLWDDFVVKQISLDQIK